MKLITFLMLFLVFRGVCFAQSTQIKGRVLDPSVNDLSATLITNLKTNQTTATDNQGFYLIKASIGDTMTYKCIGYTLEKRVVIDISKHIHVVLMDKTENELGVIWTRRQWEKADKQMIKIYERLELQADKSGKWNY